MSARDVRIGPTAHYTAYAWHRLGLPHAELFATSTGARLFWTLRALGEWLVVLHPRLPSMLQYLEARHRGIEAALEDARPDRVIELGAGLSRRGLTWAACGVPYVEVDLPHMVAAKQGRIAAMAPAALRAALAGRLTHAAQDVLAPGFAGWLRQALAGAERPVVIAEGVLGYFEPDERARLAGGIAAALPPGGRFLCDLRAADGGAAMRVAVRFLKAGIFLATSGRGARADFADEAEIRSFFAEAGFCTAAPVPVERATPHLARLRQGVRIWEAVR